MLIPNESLLYDTDDKKLYTVPNITKTLENGDIVTTPVYEWEKGKALGDYTFNLVPKSYRLGFIPTMNPSVFEDVTFFATEETTRKLLSKLDKKFDGVVFNSTGLVKEPKSYVDYVYLRAFADKSGNELTMEPVGYFAVLEAQHGTQVMLNYIRAGLIEAGLL